MCVSPDDLGWIHQVSMPILLLINDRNLCVALLIETKEHLDQ